MARTLPDAFLREFGAVLGHRLQQIHGKI